MSNVSNLQALVLGKSGNGKSEFILSMLDPDHREKIPASGKGQTTRTSMTFNIHNNANKPLRIRADRLSQAAFVKARMEQVYKFFSGDYFYTDLNGVRDLLSCSSVRDLLVGRGADSFANALIYDVAFFSIKEFPNAKLLLETLFKEKFGPGSFPELNLTKECSEHNNINDPITPLDFSVTDDGAMSLNDYIEGFYNECFTLCQNELDAFLKNHLRIQNLAQLEKLDAEELSYFIKTQDDKTSFSSLIKTITFATSINPDYSGLLTNLSLESLTLVDTYGLDHSETPSPALLHSRYDSLFKAHQGISFIFYVHAADNTNSPSDLKTTIPTLFKVKPDINVYTLFTKIDKLEPSEELNNSKVYKSFDNLVTDIKLCIPTTVSDTLLDNRMNTFLESRFGYCSKGDADESLKNINRDSLSKLFHSIVFKTHLGDQTLSIDALKRFCDNLTASPIFADKDCTFGKYGSRTIGCGRQAIQNEKKGWYSPTHGSFEWDYIIRSCCNEYVTKAIDLSAVQSDSTLNSPAFSEILTALPQHLVNPFTDIFWCLSKDNRNQIHQGNYKNGLNSTYKFSEYAETDWVTKTLKLLFSAHIFLLARDHNARCLAGELVTDSSIALNQKDELINKYFSNFDDTASAEEKELFENLVGKYFSLLTADPSSAGA